METIFFEYLIFNFLFFEGKYRGASAVFCKNWNFAVFQSRFCSRNAIEENKADCIPNGKPIHHKHRAG